MERKRCKACRKINKDCLEVCPEDQITPRSNSLGETRKAFGFQSQMFIEYLLCAGHYSEQWGDI